MADCNYYEKTDLFWQANRSSHRILLRIPRNNRIKHDDNPRNT